MHACTNIGMFSSGGRRRLFMNGNEFESTTGGWMSQSWTGNSAVWIGSGPGKEIVDGLLRSNGMDEIYKTGNSGVVRTTNKIDLTGISSIKVKMNYSLGGVSEGDDGMQRIYLFTSQYSSGDWTSLSVASSLSLKVEHTGSSTLNRTNQEFTLNVSSLSGLHYVCFGYVWSYQNTVSVCNVISVELIQ